jgi:hypothetical protein
LQDTPLSGGQLDPALMGGVLRFSFDAVNLKIYVDGHELASRIIELLPNSPRSREPLSNEAMTN